MKKLLLLILFYSIFSINLKSSKKKSLYSFIQISNNNNENNNFLYDDNKKLNYLNFIENILKKTINIKKNLTLSEYKNLMQKNLDKINENYKLNFDYCENNKDFEKSFKNCQNQKKNSKFGLNSLNKDLLLQTNNKLKNTINDLIDLSYDKNQKNFNIINENKTFDFNDNKIINEIIDNLTDYFNLDVKTKELKKNINLQTSSDSKVKKEIEKIKNFDKEFILNRHANSEMLLEKIERFYNKNKKIKDEIFNDGKKLLNDIKNIDEDLYEKIEKINQKIENNENKIEELNNKNKNIFEEIENCNEIINKKIECENIIKINDHIKSLINIQQEIFEKLNNIIDN